MSEYKKYYATLSGEVNEIYYYICSNQDVAEFLQIELKAKIDAYNKHQMLFYFIDHAISPMSLN